MMRYRLGDWKAAATLLQQAIEQDVEHEEDGEAEFFLAMARWQLGRSDTAQKSYDQAVDWMEANRPVTRYSSAWRR